MDVADAVALYAAGWFPMDDEGADELPWYAAEERATLPLDAAFRAGLHRRLRRDVRACADLHLTVSLEYPRVLDLCAAPPTAGEGVWISARLKRLYLALHRAGVAHSFELRDAQGELAAGILGIVLGRAALLESMRKVRPRAGNALLVSTLDHLAERGFTLCDIQLPTPHTLRLGAELVPRGEYERRLSAALGRG
ncbi:MAG: leucyl/phenylalanyl-tRNA--protein transferase [Solirubrobacterales bacterium]|jgi:leucyl/phenylalanyl-tRNA--protein transferase|nr:leucyl/phenylalanyl-tRNA--protein transferase [Solirubrobacterales bacterium]